MALGNNDNIIIQNNVNLDAELKAELEKERAKVKALTNDINAYIERWREASEEVERLNGIIEQLESDSGVDVLKERINELTRATRTATEEFEGFLRYTHLIDEDDWFVDDRISRWMDAVGNGAITAGQAIANVKAEFGDFIREATGGNGAFDSQMVQQFVATLNGLAQVISDIHARIIGIQENGVAVAGNSGNSGATFSTIDQIRTAVESMSEEAQAAYQPITQLVEKIVELTNTDSTKVLAVSQAFRGIAEFGRGNYSSSKIGNIVDLVRQLHTITSSGNNVIRFELTGINDLHVSKASLRNLSEYLPQIASVNASRLERVSKVDLTNFNNVKVSKASMEAIAQLNEALRSLQQTRAASATTSNGSINIDVINKELAASENAAYKEYEAKKKAEEQIRAEMERSWAEFEAGINAEEAAVELATQKEIEDFYAVAEARNKSSVLASWKANGLRESDIDSMYKGVLKNPTAYTNLDIIKAKYQELMDIQERWKANGKDMAAPEIAAITQLRQELKTLIDTENTRHSTERQRESDESKRQSLMKRGYTLLKQIQHAEESWTKARNGKSAGEYANLQEYDRRLTQLLQSEQAAKAKPEELAAKINQLNAEFARSSAVIHANGEATKSWGEQIGSLAKKFATWFNITRVIMSVIRAIRKMISSSIEIGAALTQLRIVTNATNREMDEFANTAIQLSQKLGKSVTELIKPIETFSRLGYSLRDASALSEYATILSNVASVDMDEATTGLTSIVKGFNLDVGDAEHVADVLVEVGQKYAVSAAEMMEAYEKSGAALHATNTSLEKSAGLIAAANASVQDASVVGK